MQSNSSEEAGTFSPPAWEWPTLAVAAAVHAAWVGLTVFHAALPPAALAILGGIVVAWHGSLQHETIHGHPTRRPWLNAAIGAAPLSLWLPYSVYRRSHLAHHATPNITDPFDDPESQYLASAGGLRYRLARIEQTLLGRLLLGPVIRICSFLLAELRRGWREPRQVARDWLPHIAGVAALSAWLDHFHFGICAYLLTFVYPGTALSLLRSFAEHRADKDRSARAAIIPNAGIFGLLFLNNNLHAVHHARPGLPWYALPHHYRGQHERFADGPQYPSYYAVIRRFLLRPHDGIVHPDHDGRRSAG